VRVMIGPGHAIHLGRDAVEQSVPVVAGLVHIEVRTAWQESELRMAAEAVECGLQTVGGPIQVEGIVCAHDEVNFSLQVRADGFPVAVQSWTMS
jgi:hypothetical protein